MSVLKARHVVGVLLFETSMSSYAYYDRDADIAWVPTGHAEHVVSEETSWGTIDHDEVTDVVVAIEIRNASSRLPAALLGALPGPRSQQDLAA